MSVREVKVILSRVVLEAVPGNPRTSSASSLALVCPLLSLVLYLFIHKINAWD